MNYTEDSARISGTSGEPEIRAFRSSSSSRSRTPGSITGRITLWFSAVMILIVLLTFLLFRFASRSVLQKTVRSFLLSSVDENADKVRFLADRAEADPRDTDDVFFAYRDGWLEIDDDFLDRINDVQSGLFTSDGTMLYGKNPIARSMENEPFSSPRVYSYRTEKGNHYFVYDRTLKGEKLEGLWIRGVVPLDSEESQVRDIFRMAAIFVPFLLLLGITGGWLTTKRSLLPVRRIEQAASEISKGTDLERRLDIGTVDRELYDLAAAFNGMLDRLERSFEAEQQFVSDASHELRTPMSVIMAQTELALEKERSQAEYRRALSVILRQGLRMDALIRSMLDYTRLELSPENYPLSETDLSGIVSGVADDMSLIQEKNITLETDVEEGILLPGNSMLLERALQNLIDNAYKYGREDGHISVSLRKNTDSSTARAVLTVQDDGIGIPQKDLPHIFERFYRADTSRTSDYRTTGGAGLGLSMVKIIADLHGAEIEAESTEGTGSCFSITFPLPS
ncbi:MAG: ATP-binding protein [Eubacteriales bacterium]|nr:ATP-binding protein [Eubacteriales bacterium]